MNNKPTYFLIYCTEDGTRIYQIDGTNLAKVMEDHSIKSWRPELNNGGSDHWKDGDPNYWKEGEALLIKGSVVVPLPVKVVTQWEEP
jgi:hypothetical protein